MANTKLLNEAQQHLPMSILAPETDGTTDSEAMTIAEASLWASIGGIFSRFSY